MKTQFVKLALVLMLAGSTAYANDNRKDEGGEKKSARAHVIARNNGQVAISVVKNENEVAKLRVWANDGNTLLLQEKLASQKQIFKNYDISQLPQGTYTFEIVMGNEFVQREIQVK